MTRPLALIVGAGVAGLTAAWWLDRAGWRSIIVERAPDLHDGGYMMGLSGQGYATACRMGLESALLATQAAIDENVYRDRRGRDIVRLRYRDFLQDTPYVAIMRTDLVRLLRDTLPASTEIRFGTTLTAIENGEAGVCARLSDNTDVSADLLIAADGVRSATRRLAFGEGHGRLEPLGYRFAVYDLTSDAALDADFVSFVEPGHMAEYYRIGDHRLAALHVWRNDGAERATDAAAWDELGAVTTRSHSRVRDTLASARTSGVPVLADGLLMADMPAWSRDRVVLLGDAAHCLTLVSGQGGGLSMASAERLGRALDGGDVAGALATHEALLRPAVSRLQHRARGSARMFVPATPAGFAVRNAIMRAIPRAWLGRYLSSAIRTEIALA